MEVAIEKCCDLKNLDDNWAEIIHVADTYALGQPKKCLKLITNKIFQQNPNVSMKAITLLDSCIKNAGNAFVREMSSKEFIQNFKKGYPKLQTKPRMRLIDLSKGWWKDYSSNPEISLLTGLYPWIQMEYPTHVLEYEASQNIESKMKNREKIRNLQAQEEEDLAKAIALSLSENEAKGAQSRNQPLAQQVQKPQASSSAYPSLQSTGNASSTTPIPNGNLNYGTARAQFDFEAAEDNEISFKEGDIITLVDISDQNWWKGRIRGTEGLFPAQFVIRESADTGKETKVPGAKKTDSSSSQKEAVKIDPELVENCLEMLGDADTTGVSRPDPEDLPVMEAKCKAMEPLIEAELESVYGRISEVDLLKQKLSEALAQYHELASGRGYATMPQQSQYAYLKPGIMPPTVYPPAMVYQPQPPPPPPPTQQPPTTAMYQPSPVPQSMMASGGMAQSSNGTSGIPSAQSAVYAYPPVQPVYPFPYDPNLPWQQQPPPGVPPMQTPLQQPPTAYGHPTYQQHAYSGTYHGHSQSNSSNPPPTESYNVS
ncbi:unnamed protein product [Rodentolepis nana]|uniref:SH3 domain-containing protein n=1 Tax=Rodentolepis nana TaxID=102285 RepID=A0A158QHZ3_RODNA|nr:unnamed protein product [Rodentolepis nana]